MNQEPSSPQEIPLLSQQSDQEPEKPLQESSLSNNGSKKVIHDFDLNELPVDDELELQSNNFPVKNSDETNEKIKEIETKKTHVENEANVDLTKSDKLQIYDFPIQKVITRLNTITTDPQFTLSEEIIHDYLIPKLTKAQTKDLTESLIKIKISVLNNKTEHDMSIKRHRSSTNYTVDGNWYNIFCACDIKVHDTLGFRWSPSDDSTPHLSCFVFNYKPSKIDSLGEGSNTKKMKPDDFPIQWKNTKANDITIKCQVIITNYYTISYIYPKLSEDQAKDLSNSNAVEAKGLQVKVYVLNNKTEHDMLITRRTRGMNYMVVGKWPDIARDCNIEANDTIGFRWSPYSDNDDSILRLLCSIFKSL